MGDMTLWSPDQWSIWSSKLVKILRRITNATNDEALFFFAGAEEREKI